MTSAQEKILRCSRAYPQGTPLGDAIKAALTELDQLRASQASWKAEALRLRKQLDMQPADSEGGEAD